MKLYTSQDIHARDIHVNAGGVCLYFRGIDLMSIIYALCIFGCIISLHWEVIFGVMADLFIGGSTAYKQTIRFLVMYL